VFLVVLVHIDLAEGRGHRCGTCRDRQAVKKRGEFSVARISATSADREIQNFFALAKVELTTLRGRLPLFGRRLRTQPLFNPIPYLPDYQLRVMSTTQPLSAETDAEAAADANTPSLTTIALSKSSFKWPANRPLPAYLATTSRGSVPHLTPDNIQSHTAIQSVHVGLEDFITSPAAKSPFLAVEPTLQQYLALPGDTAVFFAARRANPLPINASWDDRIEINTIDGRTQLPIETVLKAVSQAKLGERDVVIGVPDMTEAPGVKRLTKMIQRTEKWLSLLLEQKLGCRVYASIPPIPPSRAPALLDDYMDFLAESASQLSGIAIYNIFSDHPITEFLPDELSHLPILLVPSPLTPHEILRGIISDQVGEFTAGGMVTAMSDLGIALDFRLFGTEGDQIPLGRDMFDSSNEVDMGALVEGCECFTCKNHHRAYVHHLLKCHEMTAWVLLQLYPRLLLLL
jgi:hypothetical protein